MPASVWTLGAVSLLMDISSEMIHSLLPLFLVGVLGVGVSTVGIIEGIAEASAMFAKVGSGVLSDRLRSRKRLALTGYAISALTKPMFAIASGVGVVFAARFIDRIGKGIRGAPRDALVADVTPARMRGAAFGLRQALDTAGAFAGPLLAVLLMLAWGGDFRAVFWMALLPALMAVGLLAFGVREPERPADEAVAKTQVLSLADLGALGRDYWRTAGIGAAFALARFSEAFLVLRAQQSGVPTVWVPLVMVVMNLAYAAIAYPFGKLSDRVGRGALLGWGLAVLALADLVLGFGEHWATMLAGVALWGVHMGMTQGLLSAMIADTAPERLRGTAFGVFNCLCGVATLLSSGIAGLLWDRFGASFTFGAGCAASCVALAMAVPRRRSSRT